ncbi:hypothetical protein DPMN_046210 [Dreissena polymorpha]|uniref:Uncharacterized protein n=1 Tax=Dreissena polymorpha TaxID=45954 RepID=A0A9D4I222_DREPO|nr:hypothetical protein DPMN_046210 [Dreissena polymorpha]
MLSSQVGSPHYFNGPYFTSPILNEKLKEQRVCKIYMDKVFIMIMLCCYLTTCEDCVAVGNLQRLCCCSR